MKIFVTGCAGLLGANYTRHLLASGHEVIGIDDLSGGYKAFVPKGEKFTFVKLNLEKRKKVAELFQEHQPDVLIHFAAYAAEGLSPFIRNFNYRNNLIVSANLINECITYGTKIIFTSSMAVYGDQTPPFTEDKRPQPVDPYGIAKYAVECDLKLAHEQFGLRYNIVRPHNVLGIYQNIWDKYRNVIGIFIRKALNDEPILVYGDGEQTRSFLYIDECIEATRRLMDSDFLGPVNIGSEEMVTINQLVDTVAKVAGKTVHKIHIDGPLGVRGRNSNNDLIRENLDWDYSQTLEEGIRKTYNWIQEQLKNRRMVDGFKCCIGW